MSIEEKRMKFEMELESKRLEEETKRLKQDQEHELRLFQVLAQFSRPPASSSYVQQYHQADHNLCAQVIPPTSLPATISSLPSQKISTANSQDVKDTYPLMYQTLSDIHFT
ncbi:unnamed protein product [Didymodactylos carnosus]|uniref:Uncharacterized protein n=1 Tax=Didymodactylos carnosus TaxID=1234261 RepID=A0A814I8T1_9BILA|nr:unnamed protein product [Didymodactylos carnosus]CAF3791705.1 unnamed protein product [Didymodactylos carnosus]